MKKLMILLGVVGLLIGGVYFATLQAEGSSMLITLKASEVKEKMDKGDNFSLYVYSDTCVHCKAFSPVLQGYLKENVMQMYRVATTTKAEENAVRQLLGEKFQGTPTIVSFKAGAIADHMVGNQPKDMLAEYVRKNKEMFTVNV